MSSCRGAAALCTAAALAMAGPAAAAQQARGEAASGPAPGRAAAAPQVVARCGPDAQPRRPGPDDQARPDFNRIGAVTMDTESARIVAIREDNGRTWRFNVCTNTWRRGSQVHLPYTWPTPTAMNLRAVYVPTSDRVFAFADGAFAAYSVERDRWTSFGKANKVVAKQGRPYLAYDAAARRILVFTANRGAVWSYRPGSKRWQRLSGGAAGLGPRFLSDGPLTTFDPTRRQLIVYMYGQRRTWTFDVRQRTWSRRKGGAVGLGGVGWAPSGGEMAFDVEADRALAFSDGGVSAYSPDTRTRREVVIPFGPLLHPPRSSLTGPLARVHSTLVYDPVNSRVVVMGGEIRTKDQDGMWKQATDVMAYRYSTDTWSRLVRPR